MTDLRSLGVSDISYFYAPHPIGYGHVDFEKAHEAKKACRELSGKLIHNRAVSITEVLSPEFSNAFEGDHGTIASSGQPERIIPSYTHSAIVPNATDKQYSCEPGEIVENPEHQTCSPRHRNARLRSSGTEDEYGRLKYEDDDYFGTLYSVPIENYSGEKLEGEYSKAKFLWLRAFKGICDMFQLP